ncbi:hypothetical protein PSPO_b1724 [Pseudoalteromonas spongiae UST010723-006]|nr:hypothetical protein PSPO_b1724 [Pseudoalteromonas spongiae UST010723-006]
MAVFRALPTLQTVAKSLFRSTKPQSKVMNARKELHVKGLTWMTSALLADVYLI